MAKHTTWEYSTTVCDEKYLAATLTSAGSSGWELVTCMEMQHGVSGIVPHGAQVRSVRLVFKRPAPGFNQ